MEETVKVIAEISKDSLLKLQKNVFTTKGGGIRIAGKGCLAELPKVIGPLKEENPQLKEIMDTLGGVRGAVENVIEYTGNIQGELEKAKLISLANTALSGAGLAASVVGDAVIMEQLYNVSNKIDQMLELNEQLKISVNQMRFMMINEKQERFGELKLKLENCINRMQKDEITDELLNETYNLLVLTSNKECN